VSWRVVAVYALLVACCSAISTSQSKRSDPSSHDSGSSHWRLKLFLSRFLLLPCLHLLQFTVSIICVLNGVVDGRQVADADVVSTQLEATADKDGPCRVTCSEVAPVATMATKSDATKVLPQQNTLPCAVLHRLCATSSSVGRPFVSGTDGTKQSSASG
jgi:hypothetical protein